MRNFVRNVGKRERGGTGIPIPLRTLSDLGVQIRQSELTMVAGQPGVGKSSLALALAVMAKVPTLYVCADTSELTMRVRTASMLSGISQKEVETKMYSDLPWARSLFTDTRHLAWSFDATPSLTSIREEIDAYEEVHGITPDLIVIDNLIDVSAEAGDEWAGLRYTMKELKSLARETESAVLVLHHVSEAITSMGMAPPRSAIQGKVNQLPAVILTVDVVPQTQQMAVGVVKNRFGQADAKGNHGGYLDFEPGCMKISDPVSHF